MRDLRRLRKKISSDRRSHFSLSLTSMIDVFTILLLFLLKSYSINEFPVTPPKNIELPQSITQKNPPQSIIIIATKDTLTVDGKTVLTFINNAFNKTDLAGEFINPLLNELSEKRKVAEYKKSVEPTYVAPLTVVLEADKTLPFSIIKKIMYTSTHAGYPLFKFAALKITT